MPRTNHNQTWDRDGNLIHEEYVEVPDPPPTLEDALAEVAHLRATLDAVSRAGSFVEARVVIGERLDETKGRN